MTEPIDETQPHPSTAGSDAAPDGRPEPGAATSAPGTGDTAAADSVRPLKADPDRPADSGWREPAWFPPRDRRDRRPSTFALVLGLALIAIGLYYFLDRTLGLDVPTIQWSSLWPIILIVIGGLILLRSFARRT
jgi:LiaI-LiaF-like transmembrane region